MGEVSISKVCEKAKVPTSKAYAIAQELEDEGFITMTLARPRKYKVVNPSIIIDRIVSKKQQEVNALVEQKEKIANLFSKLQQPIGDNFELIKGREKVLHFLTNKLKNGTSKSYYACVAFKSSNTPLMPILERKIKKGLDVKLVGFSNKQFIIDKYLIKGCDIRLVKGILSPVRFSLFDEKNLAFSLTDANRDYITLVTNSKPLVKSMLDLFNHYWDIGDKP